MENMHERLILLEKALSEQADICLSWGGINEFPSILYQPFHTFGISIIVCIQGEFSFSLSSEVFSAHAGETVILSDDVVFQVLSKSSDLEIHILFYHVETIRNYLDNQVRQMQLYVKMSPKLYYVWHTDEEEDLVKYLQLLERTMEVKDNLFLLYEQKLLLLSLTYRLCAIFQRKFLSEGSVSMRRTEVFLRLIELVDQYYMIERGVEFYADKLCLTPKYLSELSKSVCGYTVQELVFKTIIRKSVALLSGSSKTIQEISEVFSFPNPSSFGTFFRKQTGMSPQKYREMHKRKEIPL